MPRTRWPWITLAAAVLVGVVIGAAVARPFSAAAVGYDSAASVIHFQRIASGQLLEGALSTTPKPLLTLIYGGLFALIPDWRVLSWATIVALGLGLAAAGWLADRLAGPVAAIVAVAGLAGSVGLLGDTALALGAPWAMLLLLVAGLLVTGQRRRWAAAGLALAGATLVRPELLLVPMAATAVLAVDWVVRRTGRSTTPRRPPRAAWLLALGLLALPVMLVHDWRLTGNPLYWTTVSALYSSATTHSVRGASQVATWLLGHWAAMGAPVALAIVGVWRLARDRSVAVLGAILVLWPGLAVFLVLLGARGIFVADRYVIPIDVAVLFGAAIGAAEIAKRIAGPETVRRIGTVTARGLGAAVLVAGLGVLVTGPSAIFDADLRATMTAQRQLAQNVTGNLPAIRDALSALPDARLAPADATWPSAHPALIVVPVPIRPRLVAELHLSLHAVGSSSGGPIGIAGLPAGVSQLVYQDRAGGADTGELAGLVVGQAASIDGRSVEPLVANFQAGAWLVLVR